MEMERGFIRHIRKQKHITFILLSCIQSQSQIYGTDAQVVVDTSQCPELSSGACIEVEGEWVDSPSSKHELELKATSIKVIGTVNPDDYPIYSKKRLTPEFLRKYKHLRVRTSFFQAVMVCRSQLQWYTHKFFNDESFHQVTTPIITAQDCEGGGEVFRITTKPTIKILTETSTPRDDDSSLASRFPKAEPKELLGGPSFLSVSGQLDLETICLGGLHKVYTMEQSFRAEDSHTSKHACAFTHLEPEISFCTMDDVMDLGERYIQQMIKHLLYRHELQIKIIDKYYSREQGSQVEFLKTLLEPFAKAKYSECIRILVELGEKVEYGDDLSSKWEQMLVSHFKGPVFVTHWPFKIKAFYMKQCGDGTCEAFDLLVPRSGELIGGSQREEDYDKLLSAMKDRKMDLAPYQGYLDLRRFGTVPHGGFGLGFERLLMLVLGVENIRDVIPYPITPQMY